MMGHMNLNVFLIIVQFVLLMNLNLPSVITLFCLAYYYVLVELRSFIFLLFSDQNGRKEEEVSSKNESGRNK